jgi:hypothetical protein
VFDNGIELIGFIKAQVWYMEQHNFGDKGIRAILNNLQLPII